MALYVPSRPVRSSTAGSLFDGHDAAITIMRRILQAQGCEVIHLGHDRSVADVVDAVVQEDADGVAISSYQGGHLEYFGYLVDSLRERGADRVRVYGGGGGVIVADEIAQLARLGVTVFSPQDGQRLGLVGMVRSMIDECGTDRRPVPPEAVLAGEDAALATAISLIEAGTAPAGPVHPPRPAARV